MGTTHKPPVNYRRTFKTQIAKADAQAGPKPGKRSKGPIEPDLSRQSRLHRLDDVERPRIVAVTEGLEKQGKNHFAFTAPGPIALFNIDDGWEGVAGKFIKAGRSITIGSYAIDPKGDLQDQAKEAYLDLLADYYRALVDDTHVTLVVDTFSELRDYMLIGDYGRTQSIDPFAYGPIHQTLRAMVRSALQGSKNVLLLHQMKEEWSSSLDMNGRERRAPTGSYKRAGFSGSGYLSQVNLWHYRTDGEDGTRFFTKIVDCRRNPDLNGLVLEGEANDFPHLAALVFPDVDAAQWEDR